MNIFKLISSLLLICFKRVGMYLPRPERTYFIFAAFLIVNLPLFLVILTHGRSADWQRMVLYYPGQFLFLFFIFPFVLILTQQCGRILVTNYDIHDLKTISLRNSYPPFAPDPDSARTFAAIIALVLALFDIRGTSPTLYSLPPEQAANVLHLITVIHSAKNAKSIATAASTPHNSTAVADLVLLLETNDLSISVPYISSITTNLSAIDKYVLNQERKVRQAHISISATLRESNSTRYLPLHIAEFLELCVDVYLGFHLFLWASLFARARTKYGDRRFPSILLKAAFFGGLSLALCSLWCPARLYTIREQASFDLSFTTLPVPWIVIIPMMVSGIFFILAFTRAEKAVQVLQLALGFPFVGTIFAMYTDKEVISGTFGVSTELPSVCACVAVMLIVGAGVYWVLLGRIPDDKS